MWYSDISGITNYEKLLADFQNRGAWPGTYQVLKMISVEFMKIEEITKLFNKNEAWLNIW